MNIERKLLKSIVKPQGIFSGYSFRGKIRSSSEGDLRVVQLKNMKDDYTAIDDECVFVDRENINEKHYLEIGDVLFISKGANNFATVFELDDGIPTVASSVFYVIKIDPAKADPYFIAWSINGTKVQRYFQARAEGTYSVNLNRRVIENIPLKLPALEIQQKIARISRLARKEQNLHILLKEKRNQLLEAQLSNIIK